MTPDGKLYDCAQSTLTLEEKAKLRAEALRYAARVLLEMGMEAESGGCRNPFTRAIRELEEVADDQA